MKSSPPPYHPATDAQVALLPSLIDRLLTPSKSPFDVPQLPLIKAEAPEFVAFKTKPHPQPLGLDPNTTALAAVISLATPAQIAAKFGSLGAALDAGNRLRMEQLCSTAFRPARCAAATLPRPRRSCGSRPR